MLLVERYLGYNCGYPGIFSIHFTMVLIKNNGLSSLPWKNPYSQNWKLGLSDKHPWPPVFSPVWKKHVDPPDGITPKNRPSFDQTRLSSQHRPKTLCFLRCSLLKMLTWSWRCVCVIFHHGSNSASTSCVGRSPHGWLLQSGQTLKTVGQPFLRSVGGRPWAE